MPALGARDRVFTPPGTCAIYGLSDIIVDTDREFFRQPDPRPDDVGLSEDAWILPEMLRAFHHSADRTPTYYKEDPCESFKEHVWINPFWEDDISEVIEHMGEDRVIVGSDWPHMEGLEHPRDILEEIDDIALDVQQKILHDNAAELNQRAGAVA